MTWIIVCVAATSYFERKSYVMSQAHLHLLITHLPIFGTILGLLVLMYGLRTKSNETIVASYSIFILSSIGAIISYLTGEAAEETVENIQGITKAAIDRHEDFAVVGLISLITLGIIAITGIFLTLKKSNFSRKVAYLTLLVSLASFVLIGWTGYLGGQIRHTEINSPTTEVQQQKNEKTDD
jgi:uncharacterized membrane protein